MAPRKRKNQKEEPAEVTTVTTTVVTHRSTRRVTRSLTRGASSAKPVESRPELPARKKAKGAQNKEPKEEKAEMEEKDEAEAEGEDVEKEKKAEESEEGAEAEGEKEEVEGDEAEENDGEESNKKTIVIEHCKQCNSFKTRANQVKGGLEIGVPGITVLINPDKPRRGCFEIREEGGETFISLLGLKRPFKPMKDLNMEEVIGNIIEKIK
ncbi:hypothetical protein CerSpe_049750 [Prunus speciosa]